MLIYIFLFSLLFRISPNGNIAFDLYTNKLDSLYFRNKQEAKSLTGTWFDVNILYFIMLLVII